MQDGSKCSSKCPFSKLAKLLVIVGAINWGLVGAADINLVTEIFGEGTGLTKAVYIAVGASALLLLIKCCPFKKCSSGSCDSGAKK